MSELPWKEYRCATGKIDEMNKILRHMAALIIENYGWPKHVIIGSDWLTEFENVALKSFWFGDWGINCTVEVVPGDKLEVIRE